MICFVCGRLLIQQKICSRCEEELIALEIPQALKCRELSSGFSGYSLFDYQGPVRALILNAKIHHNSAAIKFWETRVAQFCFQKLATELKDILLVLSPANSLYSKLTGKFDLPFHLAHHLRRELNWEHVLPPRRHHFAFEKQSFKTRDHLSGKRSLILSSPKLLIVDDVITSGATLQKIAKAFPKISKTYLTLARVPDKRVSRTRN